jgi:hypothetical protein
MSVIPALRRIRQEVSLDYIADCLKKKRKEKRKYYKN